MQLRELTGGTGSFTVEGATLREVLRSIAIRHPSLAERLWDGERLHAGLAVSIDGAFAARGLLAPLDPAAEVHFLPAVGGG
jgi:molybdopterin converting factor small subunit